MKNERDASDSTLNEGDYRLVWAISVCIALLSAPVVVALKDKYPWAVAVPISVGAIIIFVLELKECGFFHSGGAQDFFTRFPQGYRGLGDYEHLLLLEVAPKRKVPK